LEKTGGAEHGREIPIEGRTLNMPPSSRLPTGVFVLLMLLGVGQARKFAMTMPPVVATHFGSSGAPNGWQSQTAFFTLELLLLGVCLLVAFGIPFLIAILPLSMINVPNKEFWLAPDRRRPTIAFFRSQFAWFGCVFLGFLLIVNELVFAANQRHPRQLNSTAFVAAMIAFLLFVAIWTGRLIFYFSKRPSD
jgi:uncharacterized membrane protein